MPVELLSPSADEHVVPCGGLPRRAAGLARAVTGIVTNTAVHQGALSVADQAVVSAASFLTGVILAHATTKEELGIYYLAFSLLMIARGIQSQLVAMPYMFYCHRYEGDDLAAYSGSVVAHQIGLSAAAAVGMLGLVGALWLGVGPQNLTATALVMVGVLPVLLFREFSRNYSLSHVRPGSAMVLDVAHASLQLGLLWVLWRLRLLSVEGTYFVMGATAGLVSLAWFFRERARWRIELAWIPVHWRRNWQLARWALASHLVGSLTPFFMPWIVMASGNAAGVGRLGVCGTLAGVANMFVMGLGNYVAPNVARAYARGGKAELYRVLLRAILIFSVVVGGMCGLSLVLGDWLVMFVYGGQYAASGPLLTVCLFTVLAISIGMVTGNGLWAIDRPQATLLPDVVALVTALGTAACLTGPYGEMGAALAILAGTTVAAVLKTHRFLYLARELPCEP